MATSIVDQAITIKDDHQNISMPSIAIRKGYLSKKAEEKNSYLKELCMKKNILRIDHSKSTR